MKIIPINIVIIKLNIINHVKNVSNSNGQLILYSLIWIGRGI